MFGSERDLMGASTVTGAFMRRRTRGGEDGA